jgi:hypothetical protein
VRRRLLNLLTALSLLLCVVVAALWARSLGHMDQVTFRPTDDLTVWTVSSAFGQVLFTEERHKGFSRQRTGDDFRSAHAELTDQDRRLFRAIRDMHPRRFLGVGWTRPAPRDNPARAFATVPYSHLVAPAALLPAARSAAWLWKRCRRRRRPGHCRRCGYDLTGNVSGVCPECGSAADDLTHARSGIACWTVTGLIIAAVTSACTGESPAAHDPPPV